MVKAKHSKIIQIEKFMEKHPLEKKMGDFCLFFNEFNKSKELELLMFKEN